MRTDALSNSLSDNNDSEKIRVIVVDDDPFVLQALRAYLNEAQEIEVLSTFGAAKDAFGFLRNYRVDVLITDVRMPPTGTDDGLRAAIDLRRTYPGLPVVVLSAYVAGPYVQDLLEETESPTSPTGPGAPSASSGGAVGYLLKERVGRVADFLHSLDIVVGGGVVIDPEVVSHLIKAARATGSTQETTQVVTGCGTGEDVGPMVGAGSSAAPTASGARGPVPAAAASSSTPSGGIASAAPGGVGLDRLTRREQEVLELMAQGLSNAQIAERLVVSDGAVAKHVANIFRGLDLQPGEENRRVRAVLAWLRARA